MFLVLYLISIVVFYISLFVVAVLLKHQLKKDEMYEKLKEYDSHRNLLNRIKEKSQTVIISVIPIVNIMLAISNIMLAATLLTWVEIGKTKYYRRLKNKIDPPKGE
jgi:uncharacterized membrane protein